MARLDSSKRLGSYPDSSSSPAIANATASGPNHAIWTTTDFEGTSDMGTLAGGGAKALARKDHSTFRSVNPSKSTPFTPSPISYFIVGGGGGGSNGNTAGAGGGGGGYVTGSFTIGSSDISVIVGRGGFGVCTPVRGPSAPNLVPGIGQGGDTTLGPFIAYGGGRGASGDAGPEMVAGDSNASGGGGAREPSTGGTGGPQGNPGGDAPGCPSFGSAGGGGASTAGDDFACHPTSQAGLGGDGIQCPSPFRPYNYGARGPGGANNYFCGGGGGSGWNSLTVHHGGYGGGGGNIKDDNTADPNITGIQTVSGVPSSGGGGGGNGAGKNPYGAVPGPQTGNVDGMPESRGGNGGPGIIMIKW
tara:strand:- start:4010 stop:5086 length:1077 start_codon:yes stop_codon:yes gene_type:complete